MGLAFDALLAVALPVLAWRALASPDLFKAVVLFIAFGLLAALSWVRLDAPDIALAEAAIGAGITGALLLNTLGGLSSGSRSDREADAEGPAAAPAARPDRRRIARLPVVVPTLALAATLAWAVVSMPGPGTQLPALVDENIGESGVSNPVTAVLLNFRSYDTLLEVGVLLLAVLCVWSLGLSPRRQGTRSGETPLLGALARLLAPVMVVAGVYLFYVGSKAPGGAFQAGAVLGALAVLLLLAGLIRPPLDRGALLRAGLTFGLGVFLLAGCVGLLTGVFLEYPPDWDYAWILLIEFTLTVSIALTLTALFVAAAPRERTEAREDTHQGGEGAR